MKWLSRDSPYDDSEKHKHPTTALSTTVPRTSPFDHASTPSTRVRAPPDGLLIGRDEIADAARLSSNLETVSATRQRLARTAKLDVALTLDRGQGLTPALHVMPQASDRLNGWRERYDSVLVDS